MKQFIYKAKNPESHKKAGMFLNELPEGDYVITIKKNRPIRSLPQNKYYHMLVNLVATHTGHYVEEIKHEFYDKIGFFIEFTDRRGKSSKRYKSSADLDDAEMTILITQFRQWMLDEFPEIIIPRREDATYAQWMEVDNNYNKTVSGY